MVKQLLTQRLGEIAFVAKELAPQVMDELRDRLAVINVTGGEAASQQFSGIIDNQMKLEAIEPVDTALAARRHFRKDLMTMDAAIVAYR